MHQLNYDSSADHWEAPQLTLSFRHFYYGLLDLVTGHFPSEIRVCAAEVAAGYCLLVDGSEQVQGSDYATGHQVDVSQNNVQEVAIRLAVLRSAITVSVDRERTSRTISVGDLD